MAIDDSVAARLRSRLTVLYGDRADACVAEIRRIAGDHAKTAMPAAPRCWDQRDVILIAYGDQIRPDTGPALPALSEFLAKTGLDRLISTVHILPFCPYSSDDGFSVIDYRQVDPALGTWKDLQDLSRRVNLMFDLVLNHVSRQSDWFGRYRRGEEPHRGFFIEVDPSTDLSAVTRPRSLPLITPVDTQPGRRYVWTTFSEDQIDLNFAEPRVLFQMLDVLLLYVRQGARIIRLDAVAYLWKRIGTSCIHLPETHQIVKLLRDVLDAVAPHVLLITETNVPHQENVSYFGNGDEAHIVYQFSLPPLLLDALLTQDAGPLARWMEGLGDTPPGTTYLNFTASHDGVGMRPLEGLVSAERFANLAAAVQMRGGMVSTRRDDHGNDLPYELNVSYFDALGGPGAPDPRLHVTRFLASQAVMLALKGIPGVYFHSLVGTPNHHAGVRQSGRARQINRRKYQAQELTDAISEPDSPQNLVYEGYRRMLAARITQPAFHPDTPQHVCPSEDPGLLVFLRTSLDQRQHILIAANVSEKPRQLDLAQYGDLRFSKDLLAGTPLPCGPRLSLAPYQVAWLEATEPK